MAVRWSLVFGRPESSCCPPSCYNFTESCSSTQQGNVLDGFPMSVQTIGQAVTEIGAGISEAIGAQSVITRTINPTSYELDIRLGPKFSQKALVKLTLAARGNFPITCSYVQGASSGSAKFSDLGSIVHYLSQSLHR